MVKKVLKDMKDYKPWLFENIDKIDHKIIVNKFDGLEEKTKLYFFGETIKGEKIYFSTRNDIFNTINCSLLSLNTNNVYDVNIIKFDTDYITKNFKTLVFGIEDIYSLQQLIITYEFLQQMYVFYGFGYGDGKTHYEETRVLTNFKNKKLRLETYKKMDVVVKKIEKMFCNKK